MESKTATALTLLALLVTATCHPLQPPLTDLEVDSQSDRQIFATLLGLVTPAITNILTMGATNLANALFNALSSTFAGKQLELIPLETLLATPIRDTAPTAAAPADAAAHPYTPGEPPRRRPHTRAMDLGDDQPLQSSEPETSTAAAAGSS